MAPIRHALTYKYFTSESWSKWLFPFGGYCDHKFYLNSSFSLHFFPSNCARSHLKALQVKSIDEMQSWESTSQCDWNMTFLELKQMFLISPLDSSTYEIFLLFPILITYIFSTQLQCVTLQWKVLVHATRPRLHLHFQQLSIRLFWSQYTVISSLMEREPKLCGSIFKDILNLS
jgi:hypothetical protein